MIVVATDAPLPADALSPLFEMALQATEEAVYNSLLSDDRRIAVGEGGGDSGGAGAGNPGALRARGPVAMARIADASGSPQT